MKSGSKIEMREETYKALALKHANLRKNTRAKLVEVRNIKKTLRTLVHYRKRSPELRFVFDRISFGAIEKAGATKFFLLYSRRAV
jgi:hypothetical protein